MSRSISAFLGIPDGAPADWEDLADWQAEATLRRRLAFQSIVLALTEDGRYQRVQLYVAGGDDEVPRRIPLYWFDQSVTDANVMLAACARDEQAMLTPKSALKLMLGAWQKQDWEALYDFLLREEETPTLSGFETQMRETNVQLMSFECTGGTVQPRRPARDGRAGRGHSQRRGRRRADRARIRLARPAERQLVHGADDAGIADDSRLTKESR